MFWLSCPLSFPGHYFSSCCPCSVPFMSSISSVLFAPLMSSQQNFKMLAKSTLNHVLKLLRYVLTPLIKVKARTKSLSISQKGYTKASFAEVRVGANNLSRNPNRKMAPRLSSVNNRQLRNMAKKNHLIVASTLLEVTIYTGHPSGNIN